MMWQVGGLQETVRGFVAQESTCEAAELIEVARRPQPLRKARVIAFDPHRTNRVYAGTDGCGVADRVLGEVSVTVPPANSRADVTAGARFLAAVSSDAIRSWEFRISGNNHAGFDDMLITWVAIPVPEPSSLMLALAAATLAGLRIARRVRGPA